MLDEAILAFMVRRIAMLASDTTVVVEALALAVFTELIRWAGVMRRASLRGFSYKPEAIADRVMLAGDRFNATMLSG